MSNKSAAVDLGLSGSETPDLGSKSSLIGIEAHKEVYKDFYDCVESHERKYSKPRNFARVGCAVALASVASCWALVDGPGTLLISGTALGVGSYLYGLQVMSDYRVANNCRQVIHHHNLVIDYLNASGMELGHNEGFPVTLMEEIDDKSLRSYVNDKLEKQRRNKETATKPAIVKKMARPNREHQKVMYDTLKNNKYRK